MLAREARIFINTHYGSLDEPSRVAYRVEQRQRFLHTVLYAVNETKS